MVHGHHGLRGMTVPNLVKEALKQAQGHAQIQVQHMEVPLAQEILEKFRAVV